MLKTKYTENIVEPKIKTKEKLYKSFKFHRNILNELTRLSKTYHYRSYFEESKNKIIKIWDGIREIICIIKKSSQSLKI